MAKEKIFIYSRDGNIVNDPDESVRYATGLTCETNWPGGYGRGSFVVKRDIAASWLVKMAYEMKVLDGQRIIYQGRLGNLERSLSSNDSKITVPAVGYKVVLMERNMWKRWVDTAVMDRLEWGQEGAIQGRFVVDKRDKRINIKMVSDDTALTNTDRYWELYTAPIDDTVKRVKFDYEIVSGEGVTVSLYNGTPALEDQFNSTTTTGSFTRTFATPTQTFTLRIGPTASDTYDGNDFITISNLTAVTETGTLDSKAIIEDVLAALGTEISTDYDAIANPGLAIADDTIGSLIAFMTANDDYESGWSIIQRVSSYGDASFNTWGFGVLDETGTSDGKPKAFFEARSVADYDFRAYLGEFEQFTDTLSDDQLFNHIQAKWKAEENITRHRSPTETSNFEDTASKALYGRRDHLLNVDASDITRAAYVARRYLALHKDPLRKTSFTIKGSIDSKSGMPTPVGWVRGGKRVKVMDYGGGTTYFLRRTEYRADEVETRCEPDLPPDDLAIYLAQVESGVVS